MEADSAIWNFSVTRTKDETKSTEDKTEYTYAVTGAGGEKLDYEKDYTPYFKQVTGVQLLEPADAKPTGTPEPTIRCGYFDKAGTDTAEFYKTGDRLYTAVVNGAVYGKVTQDDVQKIVSGARALQTGKAAS